MFNVYDKEGKATPQVAVFHFLAKTKNTRSFHYYAETIARRTIRQSGFYLGNRIDAEQMILVLDNCTAVQGLQNFSYKIIHKYI